MTDESSAPAILAAPDYQCAPGLLVHDWGESTAVVFVPATASTHLIDGLTAAWLASLGGLAAQDQAGDSQTAAETTAALADQIPALLQAGILLPRAAA